jgi:predicted dehydrogenase
MKKIFRMGVIGCGGVSGGHIRGIMDSPDLELTALCDILPEKLAEKMKQSGVPEDACYSDYRALLDSGKVDAVSICTPNNVHYPMAMDAVKRNIPYAVEKPVCNSAAEALTLAEETEKKKLPHMVCFSYRFVPAARYARDIVAGGELGKLYHINGEYLQGWGLPGPGAMEFGPFVWRFNKEIAGSGACGDLGCHMLDLFRFITNREFKNVMADMDTFITKRKTAGNGADIDVDVDDYINIIGQMDGPLAASLLITRFAYSRGNYQRVEIYGDYGAIRYNLEETDSIEVNMGNEPMRMGRRWCAVPVPEKYRASQMQCFADVLNRRGDGLTATIRDGYINQHIIDNLLLSAETGRRMDTRVTG